MKKKQSKLPFSGSIDVRKLDQAGKVMTGLGASIITTGAALGTVNKMRGRKFGKAPLKAIAGGFGAVLGGTTMRTLAASKYKQIKSGKKRKKR